MEFAVQSGVGGGSDDDEVAEARMLLREARRRFQSETTAALAGIRLIRAATGTAARWAMLRAVGSRVEGAGEVAAMLAEPVVGGDGLCDRLERLVRAGVRAGGAPPGTRLDMRFGALFASPIQATRLREVLAELVAAAAERVRDLEGGRLTVELAPSGDALLLEVAVYGHDRQRSARPLGGRPVALARVLARRAGGALERAVDGGRAAVRVSVPAFAPFGLSAPAGALVHADAAVSGRPRRTDGIRDLHPIPAGRRRR